MVKIVKWLKMDVFKNDDENGGAMAEAIKHNLPTEIVFHSQTKKNGRLWGNVEPDNFLTMLEKNNGLYEVMTKFPHKVYFDIDKKGFTDETYLVTMKGFILQYFPEADMAISGSITDEKTSYHIVLQNYHIRNENERQQMKHIVKHMKETMNEGFDGSVYTNNRNMKCINQSKDDGRIQVIFENPDYRAHCITCFIGDVCLPFYEMPEEVKLKIKVAESNKTFDLGMLPKMRLATPETFDSVNATPEEILAMCPVDKSFYHSYTHLVARFCYTNKIPFETFMGWIAKKHNPMTEAIWKKWENHFKVIDKFLPVTTCKMISVLNTFYPHIKKDIHFRQFSDTFELPPAKIRKIETISQTEFSMPEKYSIFNVGMGGGKTAQTIDYLKGKPNYLWIAPNRALANNTKKRFEVEGMDLCHYEEVSVENKKLGKLKEETKLIICLNSIHYIEDTKYDILVIDEIETLIDKFLGDFLEQGALQLKSKIWQIFVKLFRSAEKVVLLDAFITTKTVKLIRMVEADANFAIYERAFEPQTRTIKYVDDTRLMQYDVVKKLNAGQKLFIFYPFKKGNSINMSMAQFDDMIHKATGKKGIFYNADVSDGVKVGLKDVNASWGDADYIITNNIVTCGVNYENLDFDYTYIFIASHNTPRDIIQVSYRTRHLNSGIIKINYMGRMLQPNTWVNDCAKINCPIYTALHKEILIEKKAPIKKAFQLFCVKANYKQTTDSMKMNEAIEKELQSLKFSSNLGYSYDSLVDIEADQAKVIESKCFAQQATMVDKFVLNKYYFKKMFVESEKGSVKETDTNKMLSEIWDNNYAFFFKRLRQIMLDDNHIFNKIASDNKLSLLFPFNILKTKLSKEIKDDIFKQFSFKYISHASASQKILKEIYNTYFSKHLITIDYGVPKNPIYIIDTDVYRYYEFAKEYLVLNSETYLTYNCTHQKVIEEDNQFDMDEYAFEF